MRTMLLHHTIWERCLLFKRILQGNIELRAISKYRKPLMGMAILFVVMFHTHIDRSYSMSSIVGLGNSGVDIFLFLSGIGLWFSWSKNPSLRHFYSHRFRRVYPAYFIMACWAFIMDYVQVSPKTSHNIFELIGNITVNMCFWVDGVRIFWFIPAIMVMYLFAPAYMNLISRNTLYRWLPIIFIMFSVFLQYNHPLKHSIGHLEIFFSRIPIFLIGLNCGQAVKENRVLPSGSRIILMMFFIASFIVCVNFTSDNLGYYPIFLLRMMYIPFSMTTIVLLCWVFSHTSRILMRAISFIGGLSLETYLMHEHFVLCYVEEYRLGYCLSALISIPIAIMLAWVLHKVCHLIVH